MFPWKFFRWHRQGPLTWNGLNENKTKNYLQAKEFLYMDSCCFYLLHLAEDYTEIFMLKYFSVEHGVTVVTRTKPATVLWEMTSLEPLVHYQVVAKYVSNCIKFLFKGVSFEDVHLNWLNLFLLILTHGRSILYTNKLHDFSVIIPKCTLFIFFFFIPCLSLAAQPCVEWIPLKKKEFSCVWKPFSCFSLGKWSRVYFPAV